MLIEAEEVRSFDRNGHKKRPKWTGRRGHCAEMGIAIGRNGPAEVDIVPKWALTDFDFGDQENDNEEW